MKTLYKILIGLLWASIAVLLLQLIYDLLGVEPKDSPYFFTGWIASTAYKGGFDSIKYTKVEESDNLEVVKFNSNNANFAKSVEQSFYNDGYILKKRYTRKKYLFFGEVKYYFEMKENKQ